jgi:hypothetical protein
MSNLSQLFKPFCLDADEIILMQRKFHREPIIRWPVLGLPVIFFGIWWLLIIPGCIADPAPPDLRASIMWVLFTVLGIGEVFFLEYAPFRVVLTNRKLHIYREGFLFLFYSGDFQLSDITNIELSGKWPFRKLRLEGITQKIIYGRQEMLPINYQASCVENVDQLAEALRNAIERKYDGFEPVRILKSEFSTRHKAVLRFYALFLSLLIGFGLFFVLLGWPTRS